MEKINFINNQQPAVNDTNLNKLQDNVEDAIQEVQDSVDSKIDVSSIKTAETTSNTDTYSCNYINEIDSKYENANTYSTTETVIGTWLGKPLYRKVIQTTTNISNNTRIPHNISNAEMVWCERAFIFNSSGNVTHTLPITLYGEGTDEDKLNCYVDLTNIVAKVQTSWGTSWEKYFVLNYTKTTD